ncbi:MAG: hypothetical protein CR964_00825 [Rhodobacterales bacterium]|nr:MAG: hypothetical protein CR964_00825 [Rhodobacterales bacterium]
MSSGVVERVVDQLREFGETRRGWLGVSIQNVSKDIAEAMGLDNTHGALVTDVPEGPARDAGVEVNDVILSFDGVDVKDVGELVRQVGNAPVGKAVRVKVLRDGETQTLKVVLGRREDALAARGDGPSGGKPGVPPRKNLLGLDLAEMTDALRADLGLDAGDDGLVVMQLPEDGEAFRKGLRRGDVIVEAGQEKVTTIKAFEARIKAARDAGRKSILLLIRRQGEPRFVALSLR